jgi:NADH dehydrogenase/NADH:ubiquinone oxidoreductase subunit G
MHNGLPSEIQRGQENFSGGQMMNITINGKRIKARSGETVLKIAERSGIKIPTLCYYKDLTPFGGCRLCIVEVKGRRTPLTACTLTAEDGMVIKTDTPRLRKLRKFTLQLILSEHPNACLVCERESDCANFQECIKKSAVTFGCKSCPQNDNCELQDLVRELDIKSIPFQFRYRNLEVERYDPFFDRDYNLCVLCGRCIRMCEEIRGANTLQFHHRGPDTMVGTAFDLPHLESGCQFCGACVDVCPTGALRDRFSRYDKPPERSIKTTCMLCSIGCALNLNISGDRITCSTPHNNQICVRGRFGIAPLVNHPARATKPMIKKNGQLVEVDWEEALQFAGQQFNRHKNRTGILFSPQITNEAIDKVRSYADSLDARIATPINTHGLSSNYKLRQISGNIAFIIVNTDMVGDFSVLLLKLRKKFKEKVIFIVVDAAGSSSSRFADLVLNPKPGTEGNLIRILTAARKTPNKSGIPEAVIQNARSILKGRKIHVMFNAENFNEADLGKSIKLVPLHSQINTMKLMKDFSDDAYGAILNDREIDCLYLIGTAPRLPRAYKTIIVQDCFLPDFDCDVFLPAAAFTETDGTVTDIEGKKQRVRKAVEPAGKVRSDEWILDNLARTMNLKLKKPVKTKKSENVKPKKHVSPSAKYPLQLITRENTYGYRSKPLSAILKGFDRMRHDQYLWINERTAKKYRLRDGMLVNIISQHAVFNLPVKINPGIPDHAVLVYLHPSIGHVRNEPVRLECTRS